MKSKLKPYFRAAVKANGTLELSIYDEIGSGWFSEGVTTSSIKSKIDAAGIYSRIEVRINSPGGDAFEGVSIGNLIKAQGKPVDVFVDGIAASAASIIAMCGDSITVAPNAMMMVHNAWSLCAGDAGDMRKMADTLDKVSSSIAQTYVNRTAKTMDEVKAIMDAETWMGADDCLKDGFCTAIGTTENKAAMALAVKFKALTQFAHVPEALKADTGMCECPCGNCPENCDNCDRQGCDDPNCEDCPMQTETNNSNRFDPIGVESNLSLYEARLRMLTK
jgi:ATP-dependent protease ClpP protease subunit